MFEYDKAQKVFHIYPPSELSLFGVDFVTMASWYLYAHDGIADAIEISFTHAFDFCRASHYLDTSSTPPSPTFKITPLTVNSITFSKIDLSLLSLDPVSSQGASNTGVVGFVPDKFTVLPASNQPFKITSESNDIEIRGAGFLGPMHTDFSNGTVSMDIYFKITDTSSDFTLFLKHWKLTDWGVLTQIKINGTDVIIIHVDAKEGEGGDKNINSISLRNKDYSSIDYCDYLTLGLNVISIQITPSKDKPSSTTTCGYAIRAIAIE